MYEWFWLGHAVANGGVVSARQRFVTASYDTSFSQDGKLSIEVPGLGPHAAGRGLVSQAGRLVVAGEFIAADDEQIWTARIHQSLIFGDDFDAGHLDLWSARTTGN